MKNTLLLLCLAAFGSASAQITVSTGTIKDHVKTGVQKGKNHKNSEPAPEQAATPAPAEPVTTSTPVETPAAADDHKKPIKAYANYDFKPGVVPLFTDDFSADMDGEFPAHWKLLNGQGVINILDSMPSFYLTDGNYAVVEPRIKDKALLGPEFTIEYDGYFLEGAKLIVRLINEQGDQIGMVAITTSYLELGGLTEDLQSYSSLIGNFPEGLMEDFYNHWHHVAIAFKKGQIKCYIDEYRVAVMPACYCSPTGLQLVGIGDMELPLIFSNVRVAEGGGMNMIGALTTDGKIVTTGIQFDVNKATIKPESAGVLNELTKLLKDHPEIRLEIDGHTDSDGADATNLTLSANRAAAVKAYLTTNGIDASRLTTKGYGESKPLQANDTAENKALNRRVEFIKL